MSFALTTAQVLARTKTVTRRLGWRDLQPGTLLQAVEKSQGLRKGEHVRTLAILRVLSVRREQLDEIDFDPGDIELEGFPEMDAEAFIQFFCRTHACTPETWVTRIEFAYVDEPCPSA